MKHIASWLLYSITHYVTGLLLIVFTVYIIIDIAQLYDVNYVVAMSYQTILGYLLLGCIFIILLKIPNIAKIREAVRKTDDVKPLKYGQAMVLGLFASMSLAGMLLVFWSSCYILAWLIK